MALGCAPSRATQARCVIEAIQAVRPDSLCRGPCGTILVDSVVRQSTGLVFGTLPGTAAFVVLAQDDLAPLARFAQRVVLGTAALRLPSIAT